MVERALNTFSSKLQRAKHELITLDQHKGSLKNELSKLKKELDECYLQKAQVFRAHDQIKEKCAATKQQFEQEEMQLITSETELSELKQMRRKLNNENLFLDNELKQMELELDKLLQEKEKLQSLEEEMQSKIQHITRTRKGLQDQNAKLRVDLVNKKEEMSTVEQKIEEMADVLNFTFDRKNF